MFLSKLKMGAVGVMAVALLVAVGVTTVSPATAKDQRVIRRNAPVPAAKPREGVICIAVTGPKNGVRMVTVKPSGKLLKEVAISNQTDMCLPALSPDASRVAVFLRVSRNDQRALDAQKKNRWVWAIGKVAVYDLDKPEKPVAEVDDVSIPSYVWAPDGKTLYLTEIDPDADKDIKPEGTPFPWVTSTLDVTTGKKTPLGLPKGHDVIGVSADGKSLLTKDWIASGKTSYGHNPYFIPLATLKPEPTPDRVDSPARLSRDGRGFHGSKSSTYAQTHPEYNLHPGLDLDLVLWDRRGMEETGLHSEKDTTGMREVQWSPGGKKIVVHRVVSILDGPVPGVPGVGWKRADKQEVAVCDPDGKNPKVVYELKPGEHVIGLDWR